MSPQYNENAPAEETTEAEGTNKQQSIERGAPSSVKLRLTLIATDAGTQARAELNAEALADYQERMAAGDAFPPVDVFFDGTRYYLADGFHRVTAAQGANLEEIDARIHRGTRQEALWFALAANTRNGARMTPADKRRAIELALTHFPDRTQAQIAEQIGCSQQYVTKVQGQLTTSSKLTLPPTRKGADGKEYPTTRAPRTIPPPPPFPPEKELIKANKLTTPPPPGPRPPAPTPAAKDTTPRDKTGCPIPPRIRALWEESDVIARECLSALSKLRGLVRQAQETKDPRFVGVSFSSTMQGLDQAYGALECAKPYAVCPTCQGQTPDNCGTCHKKGMVSEFFWKTCVAEEMKQIRFKTLAGRNR